MTDTNAMPAAQARPPAIILCEPQLGENIGMVARAMANFGLIDLRLVAPRDGWPSAKAEAAAASATHIIAAARVFDDLPAALSDISHVQATTARGRDLFKPVLGPEQAAREIVSREASDIRTALLFGRERSGLLNEEIAQADCIVTFPVDPVHASLNIAQAVLLMAYEWRRQAAAHEPLPFDGNRHVPASRKSLDALLRYLESALDARGHFEPVEKRARMIDNLRSMMVRPEFSETEIQMLRGIMNTLEKRKPVG